METNLVLGVAIVSGNWIQVINRIEKKLMEDPMHFNREYQLEEALLSTKQETPINSKMRTKTCL